jgi:hypothetical protein
MSPGVTLALLSLAAALTAVLIVLIRRRHDRERHEEIQEALAAMPPPMDIPQAVLIHLRRRAYDDRTL